MNIMKRNYVCSSVYIQQCWWTIKHDPSRKSREPQNPTPVPSVTAGKTSAHLAENFGRWVSVSSLLEPGRFSRALNSSSGVSCEVNTESDPPQLCLEQRDLCGFHHQQFTQLLWAVQFLMKVKDIFILGVVMSPSSTASCFEMWFQLW